MKSYRERKYPKVKMNGDERKSNVRFCRELNVCNVMTYEGKGDLGRRDKAKLRTHCDRILNSLQPSLSKQKLRFGC